MKPRNKREQHEWDTAKAQQHAFLAMSAPDKDRAAKGMAIYGKSPEPYQAPALRQQRMADNDLESAVSDEIEAALKGHPLIAFLVRANSGQSTFKDNHGVDHHVRFARFVKRPSDENEKMLIPDYYGMLITGQFLVLEAKARTWHMTPSDYRAKDQWRFIRGVIARGGRGGFCCSGQDAVNIVEAT